MKSGVKKPIVDAVIQILQGVRIFFLIPRGVCRFQPTCSEYIRESFTLLPFHKALYKSLFRIFRCHPFSKGGYDPII